MGEVNAVFASRIGLGSDIGAKYAILPGDPGRVEVIAAFLDKPKPLAVNREYSSYEGYLAGEKILVMSTGMGGPSAAIAMEELYQIGVRTVCRIGSCGGMQFPVVGGDIIIPTSAIRQEGTTHEYIYPEFPAVANFHMTEALKNAATAHKAAFHLGVVQSKDSFYGQQEPLRMPVGEDLKRKYDAWIKAGALGSEMECAAIFVVAQVLKMRAGAVLHVLWNKEREAAGMTNPTHRDMSGTIQVVMTALQSIIDDDRKKSKTEDRKGEGSHDTQI